MKKKNKSSKSWTVVRVLLGIIAVFGGFSLLANGMDAEGLSFTVANGLGASVSPEQLKELADGIAAKQALIEKAVELKLDAKAIEEIKNDIEKFKGYEEILKKQGETIALLEKSKKDNEKVSFKSFIGDLLEKAKDQFASAKKGKQVGFISVVDEENPEHVKAAGTITFGNITGREMLAAQLETGYTDIATRRPFLVSLFGRRSTSAKTVHLVDKRNRDGSAAYTAEGAAKPAIDFDFVEVKLDMLKIAAKVKVSTEMLADISFMRSAINDELLTELNLTLDEELYSGTNLQGLLDHATPFSAGSLAATVDNANNFDVIRAAVAQIVLANFIPNVVIVNPADAAAMDLAKATDGHYIMPPFATVGGQTIAGVRVVENPGVTAGDYIVGDFTKAFFYQREGINIMVGWENDDFSKNLVTIIGELRGNLYISENNEGAFVVGDFATDKAALETP